MDEYLALLIVVFAAVLLAAMAACPPRKNARVSRPLRRDPMDWHPGRFFPPASLRPHREDERPHHPGRKAA